MRFSTWWRFLKLLLHFSSNQAEIWFVCSQHILKIFKATIFRYLAPFLRKTHKRPKIRQNWRIFGRLCTFFKNGARYPKIVALKNFNICCEYTNQISARLLEKWRRSFKKRQQVENRILVKILSKVAKMQFLPVNLHKMA